MVIIHEMTFFQKRLCLHLGNGDVIWLSRDDYNSFPFSEEKEIPEEEFYQYIRTCQYPRALNHAVAMLARRPHSTGEIRQKLSYDRYIEDVIELVLYKLGKENLLNDREFCEQWIRYRTECKYGPRRILQELRRKGIPQEMAEEIMDMQSDPEETHYQSILLATKAWKHMKPDENIQKRRQKVIASLVRKGYDWDTARSASESAEKELSIR